MAGAETISFKDLCIDALDPGVLATFWAPALGLRAEPSATGLRLLDDLPEHTLWVNKVPEARTVKQRVHIDVNVAAVADLTNLGAVVLDETQPWTVLADPEGGELCAFVRDPESLADYRLYEVVVDSAGGRDCVVVGRAVWLRGLSRPGSGISWIDGAPGMPWAMVFQWVPEAKTVKNRMHWDVWGETQSVLATGARLLRGRDEEIGWDVLADPEGNEFCVSSRH